LNRPFFDRNVWKPGGHCLRRLHGADVAGHDDYVWRFPQEGTDALRLTAAEVRNRNNGWITRPFAGVRCALRVTNDHDVAVRCLAHKRRSDFTWLNHAGAHAAI
jgi:hypothetical protein